jgi:phage/plasmid-associated DNA primase
LKGINGKALAMVSEQGTGKGTLIEFMELLLRSINVASVAGIERITGRFNTILQNKRLVNINEMSSTKEEFRSNFDKIKSYITDPTITIEPKGVNPYKITNISNFVNNYYN